MREAARSAGARGAEPVSVRWHGRGGYGAKTAATLLAEAIIDAGGFAQAAPEFGPERRGAPVQAFTRMSSGPISTRGPVDKPDVLIVLDARLLENPATTSGVGPHTRVLVNASHPVTVPGVASDRVVTIDASGIAQTTIGRDLPNVPMLAVAVALWTALDREAFLQWLDRRLAAEFRTEVVAANLRAAREAMKVVADGRTLVAV